jgi:hypothetical protein
MPETEKPREMFNAGSNIDEIECLIVGDKSEKMKKKYVKHVRQVRHVRHGREVKQVRPLRLFSLETHLKKGIKKNLHNKEDK